MSWEIADGDRRILYADTHRSLKSLNRRMLFIMLPVVLVSFAVFSLLSHDLSVPVASGHASRLTHVTIPAFFSWFPWFLLGECVVIYVLSAWSYRRQRKPIVELSPEGLTVDMQMQHLGLIRWDEIEDVRTYNFMYRFVGIVPRNPKVLFRRLGRRSWLAAANQWSVALYRMLGMFIAPINIPQVNLPITADELLAEIQEYRARYGRAPSAAPVDGVWPPPPAASPRA